MEIGDLVKGLGGHRYAAAVGVVVGFDDKRIQTIGGPEDQATIQVMWADTKIRWECPLDIEVISESR